MRRLLAIWIAGCLMAGFFYHATPPTLVCRLSGVEMVPVAATPEHEPSCCTVKTTIHADGATEVTLARPSCCDLRFSPDHHVPPATTADDLTLPSAFWVPAAIRLPRPLTVETVMLPPVPREVAPRGPPRHSASPRAPPFFS